MVTVEDSAWPCRIEALLESLATDVKDIKGQVGRLEDRVGRMEAKLDDLVEDVKLLKGLNRLLIRDIETVVEATGGLTSDMTQVKSDVREIKDRLSVVEARSH